MQYATSTRRKNHRKTQGQFFGPSSVFTNFTDNTIQRQIEITCSIDAIKIARVFAGDKSAAWEVLDCCQKGLSPLPAGCTSDVIAAARKLLGKKDGKEGIDCPPGFKPGQTRSIKDKCCPANETIQHAERCCPPDQITTGNMFPKCCPPGETPNADKTACVKPSDYVPIPCPPGETPNLYGNCCKPGQLMDEYGHLCPWTPTPPKKETPPTPVPTVVSNITFRFDRPFVWEKNTTSFFSAITSESKAGFEALATQLAADPDKRVQVVGRASPEGKDEYNQQLSERRAKMVVKALTDRGIPGSQLADAPAGAAPTECVKLQTGAYACGETGADGPEDRVVEVTVF